MPKGKVLIDLKLTGGNKKSASQSMKIENLHFTVGKTGFEPATPWSQTRCATGLRYFPWNNILAILR